MDVVARAKRAQAILSDDVFLEAVNVVLEENIGIFRDANASQEDIMEAHRMVRASEALMRQLKSFVDDGRLLEHRQKKATAP